MNQSKFDNEVNLMAQRLVAKAEQEYSKQYNNYMVNDAPAITAKTVINDDDIYVYDLHYNQIVHNMGVCNHIPMFKYSVRPGQALLKGMQLRILLSKLQGA